MACEWEQYKNSTKEEMEAVYSKIAFDHATNPRNLGDMENADGFAKVTGSCGDTMEIWLKVKNGTVANATFMTDGCGNAIASCSIVTELAKGRSLREAQGIGHWKVLDALGGLPEESQHCALLAANTLKEALRDYLTMQREPWKRAYRKH